MPDVEVPREALVPLVRVGEVELRNGIRHIETRRAVNNIGTARIVLERSAVAGTSLDWRAQVQIAHDAGDVTRPIFTGLVDAVDVVDNDVTLSLVDGAKPLSEQRMGGLAARGIAAPEMIWSILRSAGLPADRINVGDMNVPREPFKVSVPVVGAESLPAHRVAGVTFLGSGPVKRIARDLFGSDAASLASRYEDASLWAQVRCEAPTVFEAEQVAIQNVDVALAWVMLMAQYSAPQLPDGTLRSYRRTWALSRARRADVVVVQGEVTGRAWLRAPIDQPERPKLNLESIPGVASIQFSQTLPAQLREAILAWRSAMEDVEELDSILAFWESVEFYASGTAVDKMFEDQDIAEIRTAIASKFDGPKQERLEQAISALNNAPLLARLRKALADDGVPYTESEFDLVSRMRKARNDFIHGHARTPPGADERSRAVAILGRMLAYRMATVAARGT
jgi:hypothetical protein